MARGQSVYWYVGKEIRIGRQITPRQSSHTQPPKVLFKIIAIGSSRDERANKKTRKKMRKEMEDARSRPRDSCGMTRKMPKLPRGTHAPYFRRLFVATAGFHELHTLNVSFFANQLLVHSFDHRPPSMRLVSPPTCRTLRSGPSKLAMGNMQQR